MRLYAKKHFFFFLKKKLVIIFITHQRETTAKIEKLNNQLEYVSALGNRQIALKIELNGC